MGNQDDRFPTRSEAESDQTSRRLLAGAVAGAVFVGGLIYWIATGKKPPNMEA